MLTLVPSSMTEFLCGWSYAKDPPEALDPGGGRVIHVFQMAEMVPAGFGPTYKIGV